MTGQKWQSVVVLFFFCMSSSSIQAAAMVRKIVSCLSGKNFQKEESFQNGSEEDQKEQQNVVNPDRQLRDGFDRLPVELVAKIIELAQPRLYDPHVEVLRSQWIHRGMVGNKALSADGKLLAFKNSDARKMEVWDTEQGTLLHAWKHRDAVISLAIGSAVKRNDGTWGADRLVEVSYGQSLMNLERFPAFASVSSAISGEVMHTLGNQEHQSSMLEVSPDNARILFRSAEDGIWDAQTGLLLQKFKDTLKSRKLMTISADNSIIGLEGSGPFSENLYRWDKNLDLQDGYNVDGPTVALISDGNLIAKSQTHFVEVFALSDMLGTSQRFSHAGAKSLQLCGNNLMTCSDEYLYVHDMKKCKSMRRFRINAYKNKKKTPNGVIAAGGRLMVVQKEDGLQILRPVSYTLDRLLQQYKGMKQLKR